MATSLPEQDRHDTFVIEGVITDLHVAVGIENLLARIAPHGQSPDAVAGRGNVPSEYRGRIRAASVDMTDDDDIENFACLVGHRVVCGSFGGASKLPVGQQVKAVVSKRGDVHIARAILSEDTGLLWANCIAGANADRWAGFEICFYVFCIAAVVETVCVFLLDTDAWVTRRDMLASMVAMTGALCAVIGLWESRTSDPLADPATDIFRKLGFADPEHVSLYAYRYCVVHPQEGRPGQDLTFEHGNILCYRKAIDDGKLKLAQ